MAQYLKFDVDREDDFREALVPQVIADEDGYPYLGLKVTPDIVGGFLDWLNSAVEAYGRGLRRDLRDCSISVGSYGIEVIDEIQDGRDRDNYPAYREHRRYLSLAELCDSYNVGKAEREAAEQAEREKKAREQAERDRRQAEQVRREMEFRRQNLEKLAAEFGYNLTPLVELVEGE